MTQTIPVPLPNGAVISIAVPENRSSFYSAIQFDPLGVEHHWSLFSYGVRDRGPELTPAGDFRHERGRVIPELTFTNLPRSGWNGLPQSWKFTARSWHAEISRRNSIVDAWAATTSATFMYNSKVQYSAPLLSLLNVPSMQRTDTHEAEVWENLSFSVELASQDPEALAAFRRQVCIQTETDNALQLLKTIEKEEKLSTSGKINLQEALRQLRVLRGDKDEILSTILWIYLDGEIDRPVI